MSKRAEKALRASIKHWEVDVLPYGINPSPEDCALCNLYHSFEREKICSPHCPIQRKTKVQIGCATTPYTTYKETRERVKWSTVMPTPTMKKHAKAMIKFMKDLLPK